MRKLPTTQTANRQCLLANGTQTVVWNNWKKWLFNYLIVLFKGACQQLIGAAEVRLEIWMSCSQTEVTQTHRVTQRLSQQKCFSAKAESSSRCFLRRPASRLLQHLATARAGSFQHRHVQGYLSSRSLFQQNQLPTLAWSDPSRAKTTENLHPELQSQEEKRFVHRESEKQLERWKRHC